MVATSTLPVTIPSASEEPRVLLSSVPWSTYVVLRDTVDSPGVRMTYLKGWLEIMSPSRRHEVTKTQIARLFELFCLEKSIPLYGYGSTTFRDEAKERGLEPDECYARGADRDVPDIALEVIVSSPLLDKLEVYAGLGVGELWIFQSGKPRVVALHGSAYEPLERSAVFPEVDLERLLHHAQQPDQHAALLAFRDELRRS
jgi:Uma2 family endonuclease